MASTTIQTKRVSLKFVWKFDAICYDELLKFGNQTMMVVDPYYGTKYTGIFKIYKDRNDYVCFSVDINPKPDFVKYYHFLNEDPPTQGQYIRSFNGCKKLCLYADVITFRQEPYQLATPLFGDEAFNLSEKTMQLWKGDPSVKFIIKCKGTTIEANKQIMSACSPVFQAMFDREWKESTQNTVEITDFDFDVVQKMVELCENGTLVDFEKYEDLYKIADKYDIPGIMKLALSKFVETMTLKNVHSRFQMAKQNKMKELKNRCIIFYVQNGIFDF